MTLTLAEELLLLSLDDETGEFAPIGQTNLACSLAAAVLEELALRRRIAESVAGLAVLDPRPTGEPGLDPILAQMAAEIPAIPAAKVADDIPAPHEPRYWIQAVAQKADEIYRLSRERLIARGILREESSRFLWVIETRRYPLVEDVEQQEARHRVLGVLRGQRQPDARDIALIALAELSNLLPLMLPEDELASARARLPGLIAEGAAPDLPPTNAGAPVAATIRTPTRTPIFEAANAVLRDLEIEAQAAAGFLRGTF